MVKCRHCGYEFVQRVPQPRRCPNYHCGRTSPLEPPPVQPPLLPTSNEEEDSRVWPQYYASLWAIPGFKVPLKQCEKWRATKRLSLGACETTAYALRSKWPGPAKSPYRDPWATFQNWCTRDQLKEGLSERSDGTSRADILKHAADLEQQRLAGLARRERLSKLRGDQIGVPANGQADRSQPGDSIQGRLG